MRKTIYLSLVAALVCHTSAAQKQSGGITSDMLQKIKASQNITSSDKLLQKAVAKVDMVNVFMKNENNPAAKDKNFTYSVPSKGISDQKSSGRCWLFSGLNVMRAKTIAKFNLGEFQFSQNYCFFYDQLEKSNLFLQTIIDTHKKPIDDQYVQWLFKNPLSDGGQFTGIIDIISKYGLVPSDVMPETLSSNNTRNLNKFISLKLREFGLELRDMCAGGAKTSAVENRKTEMLSTVYRMLVMMLGEPPAQFEWTLTDKDGKSVSTRTYTPIDFYNEYVGTDLKSSYVMLMNDPTRPYYKTFEIDMDRHAYDGENWVYLNLPMDSIKQIAIRSIKDSTMMYYSCDVGKFSDSTTGLLDEANFDYGTLFGVTFNMNKEQRIRTFASMSSHAMTLMAVDIDKDGKPVKWKVENSWGPTYGAQGHMIMTDKWFDDYTFRLVAEKKYVLPETLELLKQKPTLLPPWDPMFADEQ